MVALICPAASSAADQPATESKSANSPAVHTVKVAGDRPVEMVEGPARSPKVIIYMHGVCGDPVAFRSWVSSAVKHATLISLRGDLRCDKRPGRCKWSYRHASHNRRVTAAIKAVNAVRAAAGSTLLSLDEVVLVGYSQGARRAESMAFRFPKRYRRVALIGIATEPLVHKLRASEAVLLMAGERDARQHIRDGRDHLVRAGKRVHYLELPKARHGQYGPDAKATMGRGLDWLFKKLP